MVNAYQNNIYKEQYSNNTTGHTADAQLPQTPTRQSGDNRCERDV